MTRQIVKIWSAEAMRIDNYFAEHKGKSSAAFALIDQGHGELWLSDLSLKPRVVQEAKK